MSNSSFCLVADASCDLPTAALANPSLRILPVHVLVNDLDLIDRREPAATQKFFRENLSSPRAIHGRSEPMTSEEMITAFNDQLASQFDQVLGVFVASSRSAIFSRAKAAMARARIESTAIRARARKLIPLQVACVDSEAFFSAYGAQVMDLLDLVNSGASFEAIIERQSATVSRTYGYLAPGNVSYILERASLKGENSVGGLAGFAAKTLGITPILCGHRGQTAPVGRKFGNVAAREALVELALRVVAGQLLESPHLCLSYSGALEDIERMDSYRKLQKTTAKTNVSLHLTPMSMTGSVNVGPQTLVVGMLAKPHSAAELVK